MVKSGVGMGLLSRFYKMTFYKLIYFDIKLFKITSGYEMV
jgi:hypothetical protein